LASLIILKYKDGPAVEMHSAVKGGFKVAYRLGYKDGSSIVLRMPSEFDAAMNKDFGSGDASGALLT